MKLTTCTQHELAWDGDVWNGDVRLQSTTVITPVNPDKFREKLKQSQK